MGCEFKQRREHDVMDEHWSVSPVTNRLRDKACAQLGTSGSGSHFVEFGAFTVESDAGRADGAGAALGLDPVEYLARISTSSARCSRAAGSSASSSARCRCFSRNSWKACSPKPTCAPRSMNSSRASKPTTSWPLRRRSKRSRESSRPSCQGSKRSALNEPDDAVGEVEEPFRQPQGPELVEG